MPEVMKFHILSDLHTEFHAFSPAETDVDAVILAGDIGVGLDGMKWATGQFSNVPVIYVAGNHEFYGHDIGLAEEIKAAAPARIHVLDNDMLELDGVRILGCTLWTDFELNGEREASFARRRAIQLMPDFKIIRNGERRFTPQDSADLHEESRAWLANELAKTFNGPTVVVTHHLPAASSIAKRYADDPLNPAFASRLEGLIEKYRPALWIHGHTHVPCDYQLFDTRIVCNPRGYPNEKSSEGFMPDLVVQLHDQDQR